MTRPVILSLLALGLLTACGQVGDLPVTGTLERDRIVLSNEFSEPIVEIAVREGEHVEAGKLLLRLDASRQRAQMAEAKAGIAQAEARLRELVNGPRAQEILELRSQLAGARSTLATREQDLQRKQKLRARDFASEAELEQTRSQRDSALAERDALAARLSKLLQGTRVEALDQARAAVNQAQAQAEALAVNLRRLDIRAPVDAQVDALPFETGEQPPAGSSVVVLLASGPAYALIYLPQPLRAQVENNMSARINLVSTGKSYAGHLRFAASEPAFTPFSALTERNRSRLSYRAEVELDEDIALPAGQPVTVDFPSLHSE